MTIRISGLIQTLMNVIPFLMYMEYTCGWLIRTYIWIIGTFLLENQGSNVRDFTVYSNTLNDRCVNCQYTVHTSSVAYYCIYNILYIRNINFQSIQGT